MGGDFRTQWVGSDGFIGSQFSPEQGIEQAVISPAFNFLYNQIGQLETFRGCTASLTNIGGPLVLLTGTTFTTMATGNAIIYTGKSLWFIGTGTVKTQNPSNLSAMVTIGSASSILQLAVLSGSTYQTAVQAGLSAPEAPTIAGRTTLGVGFIGKNTGVYSIELTKVRSTTGAESNASLPSNVITVTSQSIRVEFPAAPTDGTDTWYIYVTAAGFGPTGPYLFLQSVLESELTVTGTGTINIGTSTTTWTRVAGHTLTAADVGKQIVIVGAGVAGATLTTIVSTVNTGAQTLTFATPASTSVVAAVTTLNAYLDGVPRAIEIEWSDNELILSQKPPLDNDPPPSGSHVFALGNVMCVAGCYNGIGLACSKPGQPEAFPVDNVSFLPEPVVNVVGRPQDGFVYLICANSIHAAVYTGAIDGPPVIVRTLWDRVGCAGFASAAVYGNQLYVITNGKKFARTGPDGNVDYTFSQRVASQLASWTPGTAVTGYDDNRRGFAFVQDQQIYFYHIDLDRWGVVDLSQVTGSGNPTGNIKCAVTQDGRLYLLALESAQYNLYKFDEAGSGVSTWKVTPGWQMGESGHFTKESQMVFIDYSSATTFTLTGTLYSQLNTGSSVGSFAASLPSTAKELQFARVNLKLGPVFTFSLSGVGAGQNIYGFEVLGKVSSIH